MSVEVKVPVLPESVTEATLLNWHKNVGDAVRRDENLVDLETEKVVLEVPAPEDGVITRLAKQNGETVTSEELLAVIEPGNSKESGAESKPDSKSAASAPAAKPKRDDEPSSVPLSPAVRKLVEERDVDVSQVPGTGKSGRVTKGDVLKFLNDQDSAPQSTTVETKPSTPAPSPAATSARGERREPMTRLRATIANRLKQAQNTAAMLTTFNDVNLQAVMDVRQRYKAAFEEKHGIRLGIMSFFVKAAVEALKQYPAVNAYIDGNDIVYHDYYDIGIAVASPRGLVVPVVRDADRKSFADIERDIASYGQKARDNKLTMDELTGGTFTITNGGIFGSMLSTPILNPPQSAILGMHRTEQRPVAENGAVVIRPMMYLALTYDHRIVDGAEAVRSLVVIKETLEDPARLLLQV